MIQKQIAKQVEALNSLEVDNRDTFEETLENFKKDKKRVVQEEKEALEILQQPRDNLEEVAQAVPDDDFDMIDDKRTTHVEESDDEMENLAPQSKRGRGRGSRGRGQSMHLFTIQDFKKGGRMKLLCSFYQFTFFLLITSW